MAVFRYEALDASGGSTSGLTVAPDVASALSNLRQKAVYVTNIAARSGDEALPGGIRDVPGFARHLALLLDAGMRLIPALETLRNSTTRKDEVMLLDYVLEAVSQGESLGKALSSFPKSFPPDTTAIIASGEETASLPRALLTAAGKAETARNRRATMAAAIAYPAFVFLLSIAVIMLLVVFVFPRLAPLIQQTEALPLPTRVLLFAGGVAHKALPWAAVVLVIAGAAFWPFRRRMGEALGSLVTRLPYVSGIIATAEIARFAQTLSGLLSGGVGIVKALSLASEVVTLSPIKACLKRAEEEVSEGKRLASAFSRIPHIPGIVLAALSVGEESKSLPRTLALVSDEMYQRLDRGFRMLVSFLTPLLIIFAGVVVAWIVAAVILPVTGQAVE